MKDTLRNMRTKAECVNRHLAFFVMFLAIALIGCTQCQECQLNGNTETICETEFDNQDQYQNAIADREASGAVCTVKGGI